MKTLSAAVLMSCCALAADSPFACNMKAISPEQRKHHEQHTIALFSAMEQRHELKDGYEFRLSKAVTLQDAAEWVELESKCCPFFDFQLERKREQGPLWLRLTGREGVKQFIREEFRF